MSYLHIHPSHTCMHSRHRLHKDCRKGYHKGCRKDFHKDQLQDPRRSLTALFPLPHEPAFLLPPQFAFGTSSLGLHVDQEASISP